jgi:hypothetical protein
MLTNEAWEFVAKMWDDFGADGAPSSRQVIDSIWPDLEEAAVQLLFTAHYARLCRENEQMCQAMSEFDDWFYGTYSPSRMPDILVGLAMDGLCSIESQALQATVNSCDERSSIDFKGTIFEVWGRLGKACAGAEEILLSCLLTNGQDPEIHGLRCGAARLFCKVGLVSDEVVDALTVVASCDEQPQVLRSYCIEALMDLGPAAKASAPVLLDLMRNSPDEELQQFASAAFKSVTAESEEHACGGTVAEHLRSLYRTEIEKSEKCK